MVKKSALMGGAMSFTAINLDRCPPPQIIEQADFEAIFSPQARLIELAPILPGAGAGERGPLCAIPASGRAT